MKWKIDNGIRLDRLGDKNGMLLRINSYLVVYISGVGQTVPTFQYAAYFLNFFASSFKSSWIMQLTT